jgi:hypothetical protein
MTDENQLRDDYRAYYWEHRACGLEAVSFEEWCGEAVSSSRQRAEDRWHQMDRDDTRDLY